MAMAAPGSLRIGDIVCLRHSKPNDGWLSSEDILSDDLSLIKDPHSFENCLWEVTVQNQYNAVKEYEDRMMQLQRDDEEDGPEALRGNSLTVNDKEHERQLIMAASNENRLNEKLMAMKTGKLVGFGDVIQLRHVKTRKFLTVSSILLAKQERENMRVTLMERGNAMSWVEFMPRYKYDREGQQIVNENECFIRVHERSSEYIHAARKAPKTNPDGNKEINCSLESSIWTIYIFQQAKESKSKHILAGQLVSLQEPETSTYLTLDQQKPGLTQRANVIMSNSIQLSFAASDCNVGTNLLWMVEFEDMFKGGPVGNRGGLIALRDLNTGLYMKMETDGVCAVKNRRDCSLFEVVLSQQVEAGTAVQEGAVIQLLCKGLWLSLKKSKHGVRSECCGSKDRSMALPLLLSSRTHKTMGADLFVGVEAASILRKFELSVRSREILSMPSALVEAEFKTLLSCLDFLCVFLSPAVDSSHSDDEITALLEPVGSARVVIRQTMIREQGILHVLLDIVEMCALGMLKELHENTRLNKLTSHSYSTNFDERKENAEDDDCDNDTFRDVMPKPEGTRKRISFASAARKSKILRLTSAARLGKDKNSGRMSLADVVIEALHKTKKSRNTLVEAEPVSSGIPRRRTGNTVVQNSLETVPSIRSMGGGRAQSLTQELAKSCFNVLFLGISKSHINQISIADYFPLLLNQVKDQVLAVACVQEMLRDNLQMLQTKVRDREIKIFLDLLVETEMNVTILKLLRSTCTCPSGVDSTQRLVANALFQRENLFRLNSSVGGAASKFLSNASPSRSGKKSRGGGNPNRTPLGFVPISMESSSSNLLKKCRSVLISIKEDDRFLKKIPWSEKKMYFPADGNLSCVRGYTLHENGIPNLLLSWFASPDSADDYTMKTLFGRSTDVPFRFICANGDKASGRASMYIEPPSSEPKAMQNELSLLRRTSTVAVQGRKRLQSYAALSGGGSKRLKRKDSGKAKTITERKRQIMDYFVAQLYLVADLCLDRNYVAIELLEKFYSYEVLLTILKTQSSINQYKAPVCRILRTLYIDRDPQVEARFPRLIKTSSDLEGGHHSSFNKYHSGSPYCFGLLQQIISDYLHSSFDTTKCDELSAEMMDLLLDLVRFGYYSTPEQLQDIINPLVDALDDHRLYSTVVEDVAASDDEDDEDNDEYMTLESVVAAAAAKARASKSASVKGQVMSSLSSVGKSFRASRKVMPSEKSDAIHRARSKKLTLSSNNLSRGKSHKSMRFKDEGGGVELSDKFELKLLRVFESMKFLTFVLTLVVVTTVFSAVQVFYPSETFAGLYAFDLSVSIVFILELTIRMYCYAAVYENVHTFCQSPFNLIDIAVVTLDIVLLSIDSPGLGRAANFAKTLKTVRILRLIRVIRAARLLKKIAEGAQVVKPWTMPARYKTTTESEVRTIAGILRVLSIVHDRIQDRKLSSSFHAFVQWYNAESDGKSRDAVDIYMRTMDADDSCAAFIPAKFDDALLDIVMYSDPNLVQEALYLLMIHKSEKQRLREAMENIQIISNPKVEDKFLSISSQLKLMKKFAENFEIWGELKTAEDNRVADQLHDIMVELTDLLKVNAPTKIIEFEPPHTEDPEVQKILANMGAIDNIMAVQVALLDASLGEPHVVIKKIIRACNDLLSNFVRNNETNQEIVFTYLTWFLDRVDDDVRSSNVVRSILSGNRFLIKQCQRRYLAEFMQKIVTNGRKPEYLDLFVGMTDLADTSDSGIAAVRSEIAKHLTNADRAPHILLWCCSPESNEYRERAAAMAPYLNAEKCPNEDELSPELRYHVNLITLLAGCKLGPKLQAVYPLDDVVAAILDPGTIFCVKKALGLVLSEALDSKPELIEASELMWRFIEEATLFFEQAQAQLPLWLRKSSPVSNFRQQNTDWMHICTKVAIKFFNEFDFAAFYDATAYESELSFEGTQRTESDINAIIYRFGCSIRELLEKKRDFLGSQCIESLSDTIACLCGVHSDFAMDEVNTNVDNNVAQQRAKRRSQVNRQKSLSDEIQQIFYRRQFQAFLEKIKVPDEYLQEASIQTFTRIPMIAEQSVSDIRLEPFILKLTNYMRTQVEKTSTTCSLQKNVATSAMWFVRTLRYILEKQIGYKIEEISDPLQGVEVSDTSWFHDVFDNCGVTFMCLDLIAIGIDVKLSIEAAKLLTVILVRRGGNINVQKTINTYLSEKDSTLFFEQTKEIIEMQKRYAELEGASENSDFSSPLPDCMVMLTLLRAMCDGNFMSNKDILREQEGNTRFVNILDILANFIDVLSRLEGHTCTKVAIRVIHTILGILHGPSKGCQEHFVLHTDMLVAMNRLMRSARPSYNYTVEWGSDSETLKEFVIDVLRASIEGLPSDSVVLERVQTAIEVNVLNVLIVPSITDEFGLTTDVEKLTRLQAKYLVFLKSLNDKNVEMPSNAQKCIDSDISSVEVVWDQHLHRHYFHIPELAKDLSESSKGKIIEHMNCVSQELKLKDFMKHAEGLHREAVHQQTLKSYGVGNVWHFIGTLSRIMFANVIAMNILLTVYYVEERSTGNIRLPDEIRRVLYGLNIVHVVFSAVIFLVSLVVRVPVSFNTNISSGHSMLMSFACAITDILPLWYFCYLGVTVLALWKHYLFLSVLLLDYIVLDSTSRDVLYAVVIPARQLFSTFIIMVIALYITAAVIFLFFRTDYYQFAEENTSMYHSVLLAFNYGIRATEGLGQYMVDTTSNRMILDVGIYFIIVVILRNIFFGIIINTFGELRNIKEEREEHISNRCFICGIDRHEFDKRKTRETVDFYSHRTVTHNMWNYLYFVMRIWQQPRSQDTSLEMYVRQCMENGDVSWIPIGLLGLQEKVESEHALETDVSGDLIIRRSSEDTASHGGHSEHRSTVIEKRLSLIQDTLSVLDSNQKVAPHRKGTISRQVSVSTDTVDATVEEGVEEVIRGKVSSLQNTLQSLRESLRSANGKLDSIQKQRPAGRLLRVPRMGAANSDGSGSRGPPTEILAPRVEP